MAPNAQQQALAGIKIGVTFDPTQFAPVDAVHDYPAKQLLAWVGASELRAKRALAHELVRPCPRLKVLTTLYEMLS